MTSSVVDFPPRSGVRYLPSRRTASTAALMRAAGSTKSSEESRSAADLRVSAYALADTTAARRHLPDRGDGVGDALALDVGGGAVHTKVVSYAILIDRVFGESSTHGSPMWKLSPELTDGTRPSEPTRAAAPSLGVSISSSSIPARSLTR